MLQNIYSQNLPCPNKTKKLIRIPSNLMNLTSPFHMFVETLYLYKLSDQPHLFEKKNIIK